MASGEAEPLQYTTTVLLVSIHCEGCKKKVKKVLHNIEGVYKVTVDAAQHKVTVTGSVGADELVRRLHKAGKLAALWPAPAAIVEAAAKKPEEVVAPEPVPAVEGDKVKEGAAGEADAKKPKEAAKDKGADKKQQQLEAEGKGKKPEKDKGSDKKPEKAEAAKPKDDEPKKDAEVTEPKEKGSPAPAKESAATAKGAGAEEPSNGKKGKKGKKNKQQKDGGESDAAAPAEKTPQPSTPPPVVPAPAPPPPGPDERSLGGGFPYYAAQQPVTSYNVAHPSSSVSYYAPTPVGPVQPVPTPPPPQMAPYGYYPPYSPTMMPPPMPEFMYGPPGIVRSSSPPQESYNNIFNEENANSCTVM